MAIFIWLDKYNVGVKMIDEQHQKLVEILNTLAEEMSIGKGNDVLKKTFDDLIKYSVFHFEEEEKYFNQIDYPQADEHREEHNKLIDQVVFFSNGF